MKMGRWLAVAALAAMAWSAERASAVNMEVLGSTNVSDIQTQRFGQQLTSTTQIFQVTADGVPQNALCVDIQNGMEPQWFATFEPVTVLDNVYGQNPPLTNAGKAVGYLFDNFFPTLTDDTSVAGLQAAIWEILDDFGNLDLNGGTFRVKGPPAVVTAAQGYLDSLNGVDLNAYNPASWVVFSGNDPRVQHLIVPEPSAIALLGIGLAFAMRRRRAAQ